VGGLRRAEAGWERGVETVFFANLSTCVDGGGNGGGGCGPFF
jgi:hypothetical protein